jgi:hypothetical protein
MADTEVRAFTSLNEGGVNSALEYLQFKSLDFFSSIFAYMAWHCSVPGNCIGWQHCHRYELGYMLGFLYY